MASSPAFVAYYRVSTPRQGRSGLGLEAQKTSILEYVRRQKGTIVAEFSEIESGRKSDKARPHLAAALALCKAEDARLVIAKLDRLARNVAFVSGLMQSGVEFVCVDMPYANRFTIHILAAVAEYEREMISTRIREAVARMKARGVKLGSARLTKKQRREKGRIGGGTLRRLTTEHAHELKPVIDSLRAQGVHSYFELAKALNARGYTTRSGHRWTQHVLQDRDIRAGTWSIRKTHSLTADALLRAIKLAPIIRSIQKKRPNITQLEIAAELTRRGIRPPKGGRWHTPSLSRLMSKLDMLEMPDFLSQLRKEGPEPGRAMIRSPAGLDRRS